MKPLIKKFFSLFNKNKNQQRAQSLVEFAISLPVLIMLFTGMVEYGFMLNTYLSLQDAARTAARRYSTVNPFNADNTINPAFFQDAAAYVIDQLAPSDDPESRQIILLPDRDNILISLIGVEVDESTDPDTIVGIQRFSDGLYYKEFGATDPPSNFSDENIEAFVTANGQEPADAGLLIIELYYGYEGTLHMPWTEPFFSPGNPTMLYISVVMPTIYAKPFDQG